ncbi:MAG TPA: DUF475 domain-containing protein [Gordonia sp. (in: high G+C Gram-positive bacteria)]|uniref:DUF475 domain-containing protein n=3 Tax=Gordonia TaxID=2053 RepID=UPI000F906126|nr:MULTISPECIES: DUF475 domain-containing protein [unclassified Gordonia (in: high G+C Gram-positive bacteria)]RUP37408.1 MAG: DUF475 domain-containing protein [Gordonia sp. (in: high G+C Gram-positive bacteria)]HNP56469.1 DUF475 domain-containing protein [Gordonia sp. (in: high G+C Gram-positive bacteria)]HRC50212.1 DUF475 domain-containing protein [Gordonia sp. (in: high G+C Gram-positive bacteria)]
MIRIFGLSVVVSVAAVIAAYFYGGTSPLGAAQAVLLVLILGVLEISLSFDNAVINASILRRMSLFWQRMFLTVGIVIAVFGMRLVFPLLIVWATTNPRLGPVEAIRLALNPPTDGSKTYEEIITAAHPQIAAFGGMFLLMLFLDFALSQKERTWISWIEKPLARAGRLDQASTIFALIVLVATAQFLAQPADRHVVLIAGVLGLLTYLVVNGLSNYFHLDPPEDELDDGESSGASGSSGPSAAALATGKAAFMLFLYLEVLDASFSFDGVIGAFAITADPIIIALGLGLIGAMFVRSLTVYMVRRGTLDQYVYLEHGAHWAIGALAAMLLVSIGHHIPEVVTGLTGVVIIFASFVWSVRFRKKDAALEAVEG